MASKLVQSSEIQTLLDRISGLDRPEGDARIKSIVRQLVSDAFALIDEFDVTPEEFWRSIHFLQQGAAELGLISPGLGFDRFLDIRMDRKLESADKTATPRTIEGPLYIPGAPLEKGTARLDDGTDEGTALVMRGRVLNTDGKALAHAIVDVWHANSRGGYSHFDPAQSPYNNRRRIETDANGRYQFQSIMPSGYAVPAQGATDRLMTTLGRHGRRPAHIHFFVSAPGHRHLTTQINIDGDAYLHDDFAFATRDGLIPQIAFRDDPAVIRAAALSSPFFEIEFDFVLCAAAKPADTLLPPRPRAANT